MIKRMVKFLPVLMVAIGAATLVLGCGFLSLGHDLQPAGGVQAVSLENYRYVATASFRLTGLANGAGLALLVVGVALLILAWLAAYWPRIARPRPT